MVATVIVNKLISRALADVRLAFRPCVFSGSKFPKCGLEPSSAATALGKCEITPTFYDVDYRKVKTAASPGRYGAIVEVKTRTGQTCKRFATLYRTPGEIDWDLAKLQAGMAVFPLFSGLNPAIIDERGRNLDGALKAELLEGMNHFDAAAVLFAGLAESIPGAKPPTFRTGPYVAAQKWWCELKKRTGNLRDDYYLHLPASYNPGSRKKWQLILFLHGAGERGYELQRVRQNGPPRDLDTQPDFPAIVVAPQCSPDEWWSPFELNDLLDRLESRYRIDPTRIYLTGLSMGGFGSWQLATESPKRFAAVVPICGGGDPTDVARIKHIPIWVFHGGKDEVIPLQRSKEMVDALKKIRGKVKFTVFPEAGHDSWTPAYSTPDLYPWLFKQRLKK